MCLHLGIHTAITDFTPKTVRVTLMTVAFAQPQTLPANKAESHIRPEAVQWQVKLKRAKRQPQMANKTQKALIAPINLK